MTGNALFQLILFACATMALAMPCATYLAWVFAREKMFIDIVISPFRHFLEAMAGLQREYVQNWTSYAASVLVFNLLGGVFLFLILLFQADLPWNPQKLGNLSPDLAFNIAASFITNTDWQSYDGETTLSYFSQMAGLTVQNYLSAATGLAVGFAVIRGFTHKESNHIGNFYTDVIRITLYILLPLSFFFALFLVWQGVPQNMMPSVQAATIEGGQQVIAQGPVASQTAIEILGSNGGGFFATNEAHPYENPSILSNFVQMIGIVLLPIALVFAFGKLVGDKRQSRTIFASMTVLFIILFAICLACENTAHPALAALNVDQTISDSNSGGNMEGKETRFGILGSTLWTALSTSAANGAVNSMLDSYMPLGGLAAFFNLLTGQVIYGGVGSGLYTILLYVFVTVFLAGLMVGRTPEYLGKKIEAREIKFCVAALFLHPLCVLGFGVVSLLSAENTTTTIAHGLTQTLYAYASAATNNGSSFAGFNANTFFQNVMLGIVMLIGRFGIIIPVLAIAGSLASKKCVPLSKGTFSSHGLMFVSLLTSVIVMFDVLTYFPALALGPVAEHLSLFAH